MVKYRIRRGFPFLMEFKAENIKSAVIGETDITGKYDAGKQGFDLRHADTEEIPAGELVIEHDKKISKVKLEMTNG